MKYSRVSIYSKSKILNISEIIASMKTKDIPLESYIKLPLKLNKKLLNFFNFLDFRGFFEKIKFLKNDYGRNEMINTPTLIH